MQLSVEQKPTRNPEYRLEQLDEELLLYHPSDASILYLNQSASLIWQLCDGQRSIAEITGLLETAYPESAPGISVDVQETLQSFLEHGCIDLV